MAKNFKLGMEIAPNNRSKMLNKHKMQKFEKISCELYI